MPIAIDLVSLIAVREDRLHIYLHWYRQAAECSAYELAVLYVLGGYAALQPEGLRGLVHH